MKGRKAAHQIHADHEYPEHPMNQMLVRNAGPILWLDRIGRVIIEGERAESGQNGQRQVALEMAPGNEIARRVHIMDNQRFGHHEHAEGGKEEEH